MVADGASVRMRKDAPAPGLTVFQPARGYHYSMEPFILAGWLLEAGIEGPFLDVGTGCGILALLLGRVGLVGEGIDVRSEWVELANRSLAESRRPDGTALPVVFRREDVRTKVAREAEPFAIAVANPPYFELSSGPVASDPLRAHARHEMAGSLQEIIFSMATLADSIALVLPLRRKEEACRWMEQAGQPAFRGCALAEGVVMLHGRPGSSAFHTEDASLRSSTGHSARVEEWYAQLGAPLAG